MKLLLGDFQCLRIVNQEKKIASHQYLAFFLSSFIKKTVLSASWDKIIRFTVNYDVHLYFKL